MATTTTNSTTNGGANKSSMEYLTADTTATTTAANKPPPPNSSSSEWETTVSSLLDTARPFLRGELGAVDPSLPGLTAVLRAAGAGECYHKHGTFLDHLIDVHRILTLWGCSLPVSRCGLFHSSYSNSYVDLAIFQPDTGRSQVRAIVGQHAERLVHLFCVVPRHQLIFEKIMSQYDSDDHELRDHAAAADAEVTRMTMQQLSQQGQQVVVLSPWRRKVRCVVPREGTVAAHIRTGEPVRLTRRVVAAFLLMTVADFSDQYTDYQDELFGNDDGRLDFRGDRWDALWPGTGKPGLWVAAMSRLAALYGLVARDEQLILLEAEKKEMQGDDEDDVAVGELVVPPVFDRCTRVLDPGEQKAARDLYWEAITTSRDSNNREKQEALLRESIGRNPFVGEPHLVLAQVLLNDNGGERYGEVEKEAARGVRLLLEWGSSWDKRMSWEGWVSWGRLMGDKARRRTWSNTAWGIINLGLVQGVVNRN